MTLAALAGLAGCGQETPPPAAPPGPLRILLVNDDGWNAPGVTLLRDALRKAGHRVVEVAPVADRSTSGTATTIAGELVVRRPTRDPDVHTVSGTAADAALVALRGIMGREPPDLVLAGVNSTPSMGLDAVRSGNVGAAMIAAAMDFPAVAVSTYTKDPLRSRPDEYRRAVDFTVRLVRTLQEQPQPRLITRKTVLNVNYPRSSVAARSVTAAPSSNAPTIDMGYTRGRFADRYVPLARLTGTPAADGVSDDVNAYWRSDSVTLTDLSADPDRSAPPGRTAARIAPLMKP